MIGKLRRGPLLLISTALLLTHAVNLQAGRPSAEAPVEMQRHYAVPFDQAWERVLSFVQRKSLTVIVVDKPSGLLTFAKQGRYGVKLYYNVLLQKQSSETVVYVFQRKSGGPAGAAYDAAILDQLSAAITQ